MRRAEAYANSQPVPPMMPHSIKVQPEIDFCMKTFQPFEFCFSNSIVLEPHNRFNTSKGEADAILLAFMAGTFLPTDSGPEP
jgi:hypothetical protein